VKRFSALALLLSAGSVCGQGVVYVNAAAGPGGDGTSWETAFEDLAPAIAAADALPGEVQVWVAAGTYKPGGPLNDRTLSYELKSHVGLFGGFVGVEAHLEDRDWQTNPTILSGDTAGDDDPLAESIDDPSLQDNSLHVVRGFSVDVTAVLDGFTIRDGVARSVEGPADRDYGGGAYLSQSSPTVRNCLFLRNWASQHGGGMYAEIASSPTLTACRFEANVASGGGGIWHVQAGTLTLQSCQFVSNAVAYQPGGGVFAGGNFLKATDCLFEANRRFGNQAIAGLGAASSCLKAVFTDCTFIANTDIAQGGGLSVSSPDSDLEVVGCTFQENSAYSGGAIHLDSLQGVHTIKGCTFEGNSAGSEGGAIDCRYSAHADIQDCVFTGNTAIRGGGFKFTSGEASFGGCEFTGNSAEWFGGGIYIESNEPVISACSFQGNQAMNGGAIGASSGSGHVYGSTFTENTAISLGGAVWGQWGEGSNLTDCVFENNEAQFGGAFHNDTGATLLLRCRFEGNMATDSGGAIASRHYNQPRDLTVTDCAFASNSAASGGAMSLDGTFPTLTATTFTQNHATGGDGGGIAAILSSPTITACIFDRNSATERGGALSWTVNSDGSLVNCLLSGNTAGGDGGGVYLDEFSDLTAAAVTLASNSAGSMGGGILLTGDATLSLRSSIAWGNTDAGGGGEDAQVTLSGDTEASVGYSIVQGWTGDLGGVANSGLDPQFADELGADGQPGTGDEDFTPGPGSPAIDSGDNSAIPQEVTTDVAGNPRLVDDPSTTDTGKGQAPIVDRGALEYSPAPCKPDLDGDGVLTIFDFLEFQNLFVAHDPRADFDGNGSFDLFDFLAYVNSFVAGCP
jgi:predicted outer membrane repeat protein